MNKALHTSIAINHFDQFYRSVHWEASWGSIRLDLFSRQKYIVMVNNFGDSEDTIFILEEIGWVDIKKELQKQEQFVHALEHQLKTSPAQLTLQSSQHA
jgi:hypothetical protein